MTVEFTLNNNIDFNIKLSGCSVINMSKLKYSPEHIVQLTRQQQQRKLRRGANAQHRSQRAVLLRVKTKTNNDSKTKGNNKKVSQLKYL